ncbi:endonuclease/exonuclease/phosphatase family protein [Mucilaginibacter sp. P25]
MDHIGVIARRESAKLVLKKVKELGGNSPAILSGDFNVDQTSDSYAVINNSGTLKDSYGLSPIKYATNGTFNDFDANGKTSGRIDHIFVTKDFTVKRYGILTDTYRAKAKGSDKYEAKEPSDHFPVMIMVDHK